MIFLGQEVLNLIAGNGTIAFSRGNKTFFALSTKYVNGYYNTGLPSGQYCNVGGGNFENQICTGKNILLSFLSSHYSNYNIKITESYENQVLCF